MMEERARAPSEMAQASLELPDLQQAEFCQNELQAYLDELLSTGAEVQVTTKAAPRARPASALGLSSLAHEFALGHIHAAQLRYFFQGADWVDTLMKTESGVRLVRMPSNIARG